MAANRILCYILESQKIGITIGGVTSGLRRRSGKSMMLSAICNSSWAGDIMTRKSTGGYMTQLDGRLVAWSSFIQRCVAL